MKGTAPDACRKQTRNHSSPEEVLHDEAAVLVPLLARVHVEDAAAVVGEQIGEEVVEAPAELGRLLNERLHDERNK